MRAFRKWNKLSFFPASLQLPVDIENKLSSLQVRDDLYDFLNNSAGFYYQTEIKNEYFVLTLTIDYFTI